MRRALALLVVAALVGMATPAQALPALQVSSSLDPGTLAPGSQATLTLTLKNVGNQTAFSLDVTTDEPDGIVLSDVSRAGFRGNIGPLETGQLALSVQAAPGLAPGNYLVPINIQYCRLVASVCTYSNVVHTAIIQVQDRAGLRLEGVTPTTLIQGVETDVRFAVVNPTNSTVEDVVVTWSVPEDSLLPLGQDARFDVRSLAAGARESLVSRVIVNADAATGPLAMTVSMSWADANGQVREATARVGLLIEGAVQFDAGAARLKDGTLTITLGNVGQDGGESVVVRAIGSDGSVRGTIFLGTMDPGDYATLAIPVEGDVAGLRIEYSDELGARNVEERPLAVQEEAAAPIEQGGPSLWLWVAVAAGVVIVIAFVVRRRASR